METKEVKLNKGEFIAWTVTDGNNFIIQTDDNIIFKTKKDATEYCETVWEGCYKSKAEMWRDLHITKYIFAGKFGLEKNVPVCSVEDRINEVLGIGRGRKDIPLCCTLNYEYEPSR